MLRMKLLPALALAALSGPAWAENAAPPPAPSIAPTPTTTSPASAGAPHLCQDDYPLAAIAWGNEGTTGLHFTITPLGTVSDPEIVESSGHDDLDQASLSCVRSWTYRPATQDGKPIAASWRANVAWRIAGVSFAEMPRNCLEYYGVKKSQETNLGYTIVQYRISSGAVIDPSVLVSSGNGELDANAVDCVNSFKISPFDEFGQSSDGGCARVVWWRARQPGDPVERPD
jgi:TonB family protein